MTIHISVEDECGLSSGNMDLYCPDRVGGERLVWRRGPGLAVCVDAPTKEGEGFL